MRAPASIIALGHKNNRIIDQASLDGADGYATKPFDTVDLMGTTEKVPFDVVSATEKK